MSFCVLALAARVKLERTIEKKNAFSVSADKVCFQLLFCRRKNNLKKSHTSKHCPSRPGDFCKMWCVFMSPVSDRVAVSVPTTGPADMESYDALCQLIYLSQNENVCEIQSCSPGVPQARHWALFTFNVLSKGPSELIKEK